MRSPVSGSPSWSGYWLKEEHRRSTPRWGIGLAVLGAALGGAIPTRRSPPDPSTVGEEGEASEPLGGCVLAIFGVAVWSMTFILLFVMAMPVVDELMVGDRCDGAAVETFCGIESIPVAIAVAFLLAIAVHGHRASHTPIRYEDPRSRELACLAASDLSCEVVAGVDPAHIKLYGRFTVELHGMGTGVIGRASYC